MPRFVLTAAVVALTAALASLPTASAEAEIPATCSEVEPSTTVTAPVLECTVPVSAEDLGAVDPTVRVILPDGYGTEPDHGPVPVVYLLHGVGDTFETWVENTDVEEFAPSLGALIVMPDGGKTPEAGWYSDWADESRNYETFHTDVLPGWVTSSFNVHPYRANTGIMGLSMGGFGAMKYAARHSESYGAAASFSGILDTQMAGPVEGVAFGFGPIHDFAGTPDSQVWGDPVTDYDNWAAHNPAALARAGDFDHLDGNLWLTTGTGTPGGPAEAEPQEQFQDPAVAGSYGIEHFIWQSNQSFKANLVLAGTDFQDLSYLGGPHDWAHWQYALHLVLPEMTCAIGGGLDGC